MKLKLTSGALLLMTTTAAHAVGLDRSNQDVGAIFEDGNYVELSFGAISPDISGEDVIPLTPAGNAEYDSVADDFYQFGASVTYRFNDQIAVALIYDQPYGADVDYPGSGAATLLGGTRAELNSDALTALVRYEFDDNWSVHGGVVVERIDGSVSLSGQAYGPILPPGDPRTLNGYNVELDESTGTGFVIGSAYERPDIALRVALTYRSGVEHEFGTVETVNGVQVSAPGAVTTVDTPETFNLDFQTGVAPGTLVFGQIRYALYGDVKLSPTFFDAASEPGVDGSSLVNIDDGFSYSIGVGRQFTDAFSGSIAIGYEPEDDDDQVSPLAPTNGNTSISLGGQYEFGDIVLAGGVRYTAFNDARPETADTARANFDDNSAVSLGLRVGYNF